LASPWVHSAPHPEPVEGGDDPAAPAPALARRPHELLEAPRRLAGSSALRLGLGKFAGDLVDQAVVAGEAEEKVDAVGFAPRHQLLADEATVGAQQDPHLGPALADLPDDARHFLDRTGGGIDIRRAQLGGEQMAAAEDVERQIAIAIM
jgi:hypothetical protein